MNTADDLTGVWVDDNIGGLGPEVMVIFPNGVGATDYYNPTFAGHDEFHWELVTQGTEIQFSRHYTEPARTITCGVSLHTYEGQRVLRIESDVPDNPIIGSTGGHFVTDYYLSSTHIDDYVPPKEDQD